MVEFLLVVLVVILAIRWFVIHDRLTGIENRLKELSAGGGERANLQQVAQLTQRVWRLEQALGPPPPPAEPVRPAAPVEAVQPVAVPPEPVYVPSEPPGPTLGERLRTLLGNREWEALVGGSLLNKIGALVLVVGIALFLAYSFAHMTPASRTLTAFLASGALLGPGVWLERKQTYRVFSRGLIGAGWAGLYSTAYAMYALPAARIVDDPFVGSLLLLVVAAGMISHSLRYRVQTVTGIAYFTAFAALAATPNTPFAVVALIPLAATLLYLAWRFGWHGMAVFGLLATYATCIARGSSDAPLISTQTLFVAYWLLFEGFDLLRIRRRDRSQAAALIFPLNAFGFLGLSYLAWSTRAPNDLWMMSAIAAALYLAGALARAWLRPPSSFAQDEAAWARYEQGSYEAPLTLSAFLAGLAVVGKVTGVWIAVGLALEAEILYLAGVRLSSRFLRALGWVGFAFSMERLLVVDVYRDQRSALFGREIRNWTPPALFHAALFYLNRSLGRPAVAFSWLAGGLIALAISVEAPERFVGAAWLLMGAALFEFGLWKRLGEFRFQACCLACMGVFALVLSHLSTDWPRPWIPVSAGLAIVYGYSLRTSRLAAGRVGARERRWLSWGGACATLFLGLLLLDKLVPADYRGLSWWLFALLLFELGLLKLPEPLRIVSYAAGALATLTVVGSHAEAFSKFAPRPVRISYIGAGISAWILAARAMLASAAELEDAGERSILPRVSTALGTLFTLAGIWLVAPDWVVPIAWAALAVLLLVLGRGLALADLRLESYLAATLGFLHIWAVNFPSLEMVGGLSARLVSAGAVAAALYAAEFLAARPSRARAFFSALATLLVAGLLWKEVSGSLLTVAWGVEGLLLLAAGFPARERPLRLAGLALLLYCISKLFIYDLRHLETLYRILSFVALGVILLGVSWIYTRFRDTIRRGFFQG